MSLIYPTNNSPNESPGRARNALGRSACALVVAGALVLPLTPAGAVTDPGASTPASTATVTPQVVADQEPQTTPQLVVETPDEVNPYYGKTLKIKGTGSTVWRQISRSASKLPLQIHQLIPHISLRNTAYITWGM